MNIISRRKMIGTIAAGGSGVAFANLVHATEASDLNDKAIIRLAQTSNEQEAAQAFRGQHQAKPLPFDPAKLKGISERIITSHWQNNYGGAVNALNLVEKRLATLLTDQNTPAYIYGELKREELLRTGSVVLHENYFANLGGDNNPSGKGLELIKEWFGSYELWEMEFKKTGNALAGGSGWVILAYNLQTNELHNYWAADHAHNATLGYPLLVLDMYEHAYHIDYGAAAAQYIDAFMQNINWEEVNRRAEAAIKQKTAIGMESQRRNQAAMKSNRA